MVRGLRLIGLALVGTACAFVALLLPYLPGVIPIEIARFFKHPLTWFTAFVVVLFLDPATAAQAIPHRLRQWVGGLFARPLRVHPLGTVVAHWREITTRIAIDRASRPEGLAAWALRGPAPITLATGCALLLATWVPHYLTWPWWADTDQFAVSALAWDNGLRPYRDLADFDFPGPIYLFYILGKVFGWGRTVPLYAVDAALLLALGVALAAWSRRLFGKALPGLVSYFLFLGFYLSLDYALVAQREWHASFFVVSGLLALEAWPGRAGRIVSALAVAAALAYRPQVVLFLPALATAVVEGGRRPGEPWTRALGALIEWAALLAVAVVLAFSPLLLAGVFDDFLRALRITRYRGGAYNHTTWLTFLVGLSEQWQPWQTRWVLDGVVLLAVFGPPGLRRPARTWALALLGALLYKPISPHPHGYLIQPLMLVRSIDVALLVAWLLATPLATAPMRLAALALVLIAGMPRLPTYCSASRSLAALGPLRRGEDPAAAPLGCAHVLPSGDRPGVHYHWEDYRRLLDYLRHETPPRTRVANFLKILPYPTLNGPSGRLTPFPAAGGNIHLWLVDPGLEGRYAEALERTPDTIVVWDPHEDFIDGFMKCKRVTQAVRRSYQPEIRFGNIEVWRRKPEPEAPGDAVPCCTTPPARPNPGGPSGKAAPGGEARHPGG
ncbi:MAG: hypothetical protein IRY99_08515 [Isosphaeraceae bacterium]|nr:hypothetical protein [Isosphaeraceae bacterium]